MNLYLDNAATTYPKPSEVTCAVFNFMSNIGASSGRSSYSNALEADKIVYTCREKLSDFFGFDKPQNVVFTSNITASINILIKSVVKKGWHVITSSMDHNSVLRPLYGLNKANIIDLDVIECSKEGIINIDDFKNKIKDTTKLVVLSHSSNIIGSIQPLHEIGKICKEHNIYFIIDSAQTAGVLPINFNELNCSALAFTGHKSLLGPQGIGGFIISDKMNMESVPFIEGGTGSSSYSTIQPDYLPDKYESGTLNTPGIAGLEEGINFISNLGLTQIRQKEQLLTSRFIEGLLNIPSIIVYGSLDAKKRTPVVSINSTKISNSELGYTLDNEYGIMARTGLHCAPLAHKTIGTFPEGTLRFSFGPFNNIKDIDYTLYAIMSIIKGM